MINISIWYLSYIYIYIYTIAVSKNWILVRQPQSIVSIVHQLHSPEQVSLTKLGFGFLTHKVGIIIIPTS